MRTFIIVQLRIEGLHHWPDAASIEPDVAFLAHPHRHEFHIKLRKQVNHDDRDIEIIMFKREVEMYLMDNFYDENWNMCDFDTLSCEQIAYRLLMHFDCEEVEVLEDGENGAVVSL